MSEEKAGKSEEPVEEEFSEDYDDPLRRIKGVDGKLAVVLRDAGYYTVESVAVEAPHVLFERVGERAGFSLKKAEEITRNARKHIKVQVLTLEELEAEEAKRQRITTGCNELDGILGGGIATGELTGTSGAYGTGKTELVFTVALNAFRLFGAGAWIIDTEGTTSARRILQMAEAQGLPVGEVKKHVIFSRVIGTADLIATIEGGHKFVNKYNLKFIGVDTLVNPFRAEYPGREMLPTRQFRINRCLRRLLDYARAYDLAVLVTNQVHAEPVAVFTSETRPEILNPPTGGHVFCLHPSTLVCTLDYGVVPVSKVHNPVMLLSGEQEVGICDGVRRSRPNIALRINEELECSPEHRLLKFDNGRIVPCQAKDIKVGDWLVVARRIDYSVEKDVRLPEIQVEYVYKILNGNEVKQKLKTKGLSLKRREHVERLGVKPRHLRRILNQQYPTKLHVIKAIEQFIGSEVSYKKVVTKKHRDIQIPTYLTPELAQIFGYWLGDGSTLHRNSVLLADERLEVLQHYAALLRKVFNLNSRIIKSHKNCYKLVCNSRHAMKILNWLLGNLNLLPQAKKEVVRGFLRGIFDAEGCGDYRCVKMSNIYDGPVLYTKICLLRFGIFSTIKREMQTNISGRTIAPFVLEITSSNVDKFYAEIGFTSPSKAIGRTNVKRRTPQKYRFLSEHLAIRRVDSIKEVPTDDVFIDISVKPNETFLANGYVVHNSYAVNSHLYMRRASGAYIAVLIDSSYMPRAEARYTITSKGISDVEVKKK